MAATLLTVCGCSKRNFLNRTVWYGTSQVEKDGEKGVAVTSLYFIDGDTVDVYRSVAVDGKLVVPPYKSAAGTYVLDGKRRARARMSIDAAGIGGLCLRMNGICRARREMILVSSDSTVGFYRPLKGVRIPENDIEK